MALLGVITMCLCVHSTTVHGQACINPPLLGHKGFRMGSLVKFRFIGAWNPAIMNCVKDAIDAWNNVHALDGRATYHEVTGAEVSSITLVLTPLGGATGGGTTAPSLDSEGYTTGIGVQFNSNTGVLSTCDGFKKVALHEFGHVQGLDDTFGSNGSSVMNQMSGGNDAGNNLPLSPTSCDAQSSRQSQPPPDPCAFGCPPGYTTTCVGDQEPDPAHCYCCVNYSPILIDLNGDGFRMSSADDGVWWRINDIGTSIALGWPRSGDDVWLALDRNQNGMIDDGSELFGNTTYLRNGTIAEHGYEALADHDANHDGRIDRDDPIFDRLLVWSDQNRNAVSEADELRTLSAAGVRFLGLAYRETRWQDQWGNRFRFVSTVGLRGGRRVLSVDVYPTTGGPISCATR